MIIPAQRLMDFLDAADIRHELSPALEIGAPLVVNDEYSF
jgi:hypothetical protein